MKLFKAANILPYHVLSEISAEHVPEEGTFSFTSSCTIAMKSTKVQTLGAYCIMSLVHHANARARKLATPLVVAVTRGAVSSRSNTG